MSDLRDIANLANAGALDKVADVFHKLAGPLAAEVGLMMAEKAREYRMKNMVNVFMKTKKILAEAGLSEKAVPPRIFLPILDASSLEEDESLQNLWAGLLASASEESDALSPAFVETLKQLIPQQANALNDSFELWQSEERAAWTPAFMEKFLSLENDQPTFRLTMNAFERLGLMVKIYDLHKKTEPLRPFLSMPTVTHQYRVTPMYDQFYNPYEAPLQFPEDKNDLPELTYTYGFTQYGVHFMMSCRGPKEKSNESSLRPHG